MVLLLSTLFTRHMILVYCTRCRKLGLQAPVRSAKHAVTGPPRSFEPWLKKAWAKWSTVQRSNRFSPFVRFAEIRIMQLEGCPAHEIYETGTTKTRVTVNSSVYLRVQLVALGPMRGIDGGNACLCHMLLAGAPAQRPRAESYHCSGVGRTGSPGRVGRMNLNRTIAQMFLCRVHFRHPGG